MLWQLEKNLQFVDVAVVDITHGFTVAGLRFYHGSKVFACNPELNYVTVGFCHDENILDIYIYIYL